MNQEYRHLVQNQVTLSYLSPKRSQSDVSHNFSLSLDLVSH